MATEEHLVAACRNRADHMAARLTAAGFTPRVRLRKGRTRIETKVPDLVSAEAWRELLEVLETADSFGLVDGQGGRIAWAALDKETPATANAARGHGHQL
ncbi:hypothetical protein M1P56_27880 [Streptomyces sp. HU2014]|uniref:hypothetical protein n=1 Tax=Streptomyces sp. HU2014 TaxID=2939414 RepID=UPI0020104454|nr:hypothetical protein [Streptomyces sp. HU2014]UQI47883.1 hypothetical protein M1P56_27880 [Streptomyces sp. HU2014]